MTLETIREELEIAVMPLLDGAPAGQLLANQVRMRCEATLQRLRVRAKVEVLHGGQLVRVGLVDGDRVRSIFVHFEL